MSDVEQQNQLLPNKASIVVIVIILVISVLSILNPAVRVNIYKYIHHTATKFNIITSTSRLNSSVSSTGPTIPRRQFDLVLSYYTENVEFVASFVAYIRSVKTISKLNPYVIVYNKNSKANVDVLKTTIKADVVKTLPNVGREGGTFLSHIIENYDTLADHTFFSQAGFEGLTAKGPESWLVSRLEKQFNATVGYMPMVTNGMIANYDCGHGQSGNFLRLTELWGILEQTLCPPNGQAVSYRGQFLVSRRRIQNRSLDVYKYVQTILTANSSHWIHRDDNHGWFVSQPENPIFGHVVERLWTMLFHCTSPDLPQRCLNEKCACYD